MCFSCCCNVNKKMVTVVSRCEVTFAAVTSAYSVAVSPSQPLNDTAQFLVRSAVWKSISWCMSDVEQSDKGLATEHYSFKRWIMQQIISKNIRAEIQSLSPSDLKGLQYMCLCLELISLQIAWQSNTIVPGDWGLGYENYVNENLCDSAQKELHGRESLSPGFVTRMSNDWLEMGSVWENSTATAS